MPYVKGTVMHSFTNKPVAYLYAAGSDEHYLKEKVTRFFETKVTKDLGACLKMKTEDIIGRDYEINSRPAKIKMSPLPVYVI